MMKFQRQRRTKFSLVRKAFVKENKGRYECGGYIYSGEGQELGQFLAKAECRKYKTAKDFPVIPALQDDNGNYSISGATYGVFADKECQKQLATLTTDENGNTDVVRGKSRHSLYQGIILHQQDIK